MFYTGIKVKREFLRRFGFGNIPRLARRAAKAAGRGILEEGPLTNDQILSKCALSNESYQR